MPVTPTVFCAVMAVTTDAPYTPSAEKVLEIGLQPRAGRHCQSRRSSMLGELSSLHLPADLAVDDAQHHAIGEMAQDLLEDGDGRKVAWDLAAPHGRMDTVDQRQQQGAENGVLDLG
ncbi:MAG: hypothetical protein KatS3mg060_1112 [Dehalococcoidia bacterium]|nr:MAG: hypothetical protein KatS3mg060_1112 [Dehalococcoidia bacterium]